MEHTWQTHHLPKLEISNDAAGDIAVCGSFAECDSLQSELDHHRICFIAPLSSRSDLEWLLRGLHLHPNIRHLVLCGDDYRATGEALRALWADGLDTNGNLPGSRGRLSDDIDATAVDALRNSVQFSDLREIPLGDLAEALRALAESSGKQSASANRKTRALANPTIPERTVFLSRKTTFPIFSSDVGDSWLQLLNLTLKIGTEKQSANGERMAEALNAIVTIETPVLEDGESKQDEFPDFLDFTVEDYKRFRFPFFDERMSDWGGKNQLEDVCDRLKKSLDTRSGSVVFLTPNDLVASRCAPDMISATFNVIDHKLYGSFVLRSVDLYTDWPLEAMALADLQSQVSERLGLEKGSLTFVIHSAHLYDRDWARSLRVLHESFKRPLPLHVDPSGVFLFGNDGGKARAMLLNHDASAIMWEDAFSDPEDLSWYIVDVMPWLLPQHIRYVGQECASLMRAMREKECYEQG